MRARSFPFAIVCSVVFHGTVVLFSFVPGCQLEKPVSKAQSTQISYFADTQPPHFSTPSTNASQKYQDSLKAGMDKLAVRRDDVKAASRQEAAGLDDRPLKKPVFLEEGFVKKPDLTPSGSSPKIVIPFLGSDEIEGPAYEAYYQAIGRDIRRTAYDLFDRSSGSKGVVYVAFLLKSDGNLEGIRVLSEKTTAPSGLQQQVVRIIRAASPFMAFPDGLDVPAVTIKVMIEFR